MPRTRMLMTRLALAAGLLLAGCLKSATGPSTPRTDDSGRPQPPVAPRQAVVHELHGDRRVDEYDWLRNRDAPEVQTYLEAENSYTRSMMRATAKIQRTLAQEFAARQPQGERLPSVRRGDYDYYARTAPDQEHPLYCRKRG